MEKQREIYAEWLRIVAAFSVVFQHTVSSAWYDAPVNSLDFFALNFMNSLARFGVGVFIMLSGAFMLSPEYSHPPKKIFTHNLPKILVVLIFWVVVYGVINTVAEGGTALDILSTPALLFTDPATHLWFLYTLAGLYLITPALRVFTEHASKNMVLYVICIFFVFGLAIPTVSHLVSKFTDVDLYRNLGIRGTTTYAGFYLAGFYLSKYGLGQKARHILYVMALVSWVLAFYYSTYVSVMTNKPNEYFFGNFQPTTFLEAAALFCLFRTRYAKQVTTNPRLIRLSACMLGVYLVHPIFLKAFYGLKLTLLGSYPLLTAPVVAVVFFALSLAFVRGLRAIPWVKKII